MGLVPLCVLPYTADPTFRVVRLTSVPINFVPGRISLDPNWYLSMHRACISLYALVAISGCVTQRSCPHTQHSSSATKCKFVYETITDAYGRSWVICKPITETSHVVKELPFQDHLGLPISVKDEVPSAIGVSPGKLYDAIDAALGRMAFEIDENVKTSEINGTGVELHTSKKVGRVKTFYEIRATIHSMDTVRAVR